MEIARDEDEGEMDEDQVNTKAIAYSDQDQPEDTVASALKLVPAGDKIRIDI